MERRPPAGTAARRAAAAKTPIAGMAPVSARTPPQQMRWRIAEGAMAGTAWSPHREHWASLRPAARERETREDDAAPGQRECRPFSSWGDVRRTRSCGFLPVGLDTTTPQGRGPFLAVRLHGTQARATNGVCHSNVRIPPNAEIPAEKGPPRNGESFPPPACGGLCRPEAGPVLPVGVPSRPRRRAPASRALPATVSMRNPG